MKSITTRSLRRSSGLLLLLLLGMSGCNHKNKKSLKRSEKNKPVLFSEVDIPAAKEDVIYKYLDDVDEFKTLDDAKLADFDDAALFDQLDDDSWNMPENQKRSFKTVYFDFNKYTIRPDQEATVNANIAYAKELLAQGAKELVINGHADSSAGSRAWNMTLSEYRAQALADRFAAAGIPREVIKIVGRGSDIPAIINGQAVKGDRIQQAPNRRDEIRVLHV